MARPVVIYVTPRPPYPLIAGLHIRQFELLRAYADWARVHLLTFWSDEGERVAARELEAYCERVHLVPSSTTIGAAANQGARAHRVASRLFGHRPNLVNSYYSSELRSLLDTLAAS